MSSPGLLGIPAAQRSCTTSTCTPRHGHTTSWGTAPHWRGLCSWSFWASRSFSSGPQHDGCFTRVASDDFYCDEFREGCALEVEPANTWSWQAGGRYGPCGTYLLRLHPAAYLRCHGGVHEPIDGIHRGGAAVADLSTADPIHGPNHSTDIV